MSFIKQHLQQAKRSCRTWAHDQGHELGPWHRVNGHRAESSCTLCGAVWFAAIVWSKRGAAMLAGCDSGIGPCQKNPRKMAQLRRFVRRATAAGRAS